MDSRRMAPGQTSRDPQLAITDWSGLVNKMTDVDKDIRYMALEDLHQDLVRAQSVAQNAPSQSSSSRGVDYKHYVGEDRESLVTKTVLKLLLDPIAEIKNLSVACIGEMVKRARPPQLRAIIDQLLQEIATSDKANEENQGNRDVSCLALKSVVLNMPTDGGSASQSVETIAKQIFTLTTSVSALIFKAHAQTETNTHLASELLQILTDLYNRYPHIINTFESLRLLSINSLIQILSSAKLSVRKRAIPAVSSLVATNPSLFAELKPKIAAGLGAGGDAGKTWTMVIAALARGANATKIGSLVADGKVVDAILEQTEDPEDTDTTEGALVALEVLVLRCPGEVTPYVSQISLKALELVKYDPNFVELDEDDIDMENGDDDEDDFDEDGYSDDDDVSWRIRRSAAKVIAALLSTRGELLTDFYRDMLPILITRINEREEGVRVEVLAALEILVKQTASARQAELASGGRNKRKRSEGMEDDSAPEDSVTQPLDAAIPQILRGLLKQLDSKSAATKEQSFELLRQITIVLTGGLQSEGPRIVSAAAQALRSIDSAASSSLSISALAFLSTFFQHHSPRVYSAQLPELAKAIVRCMRDKLQRVSMEAFSAASSLATSLRARGSASPIKSDNAAPIKLLFDTTSEVLADTSVDGEIRERALDTLGKLLVHEGTMLGDAAATALPLISARLEVESTAATAVAVIGQIADAPTCKGEYYDEWLISVLPAIVVALRRSRRGANKHAEVATIDTILSRSSDVSAEVASAVLAELQPILGTPAGLNVVAVVLTHVPSAQSHMEPHLGAIYELLRSPGLSPALVDALVNFFAAYTAADPDGATRTAPRLMDNLDAGAKAAGGAGIPDAANGGTAVFGATARVVGAVAKHSMRNAAGILALFIKMIKKEKDAREKDVYLALLSIGEIGRLIDLSTDGGLFERVLTFFKHPSEEVRTAAAFAAGNLAVGSHEHFLPLLVKHIEAADSETSRVLLLHALKEVILHTPSAQLELLAESLWKPLIADDVTESRTTRRQSPVKKDAKSGSAKDDIGDEGVRNVKAACIGKLTTTAPAKFLPQLQALLQSSPRNRAIVAAAVRYTFIDNSNAYDELISPIIVDFLSLMHDENLIVRRLSLASLNAAIQNKPHLIVDRLAALQPLLYEETVVKKELQREVQMGPFKMIEDDGLENRKTAYEAMYTLLATCFNRIDLPAFTDRVMAALSDVNEVKVLGLMLLLRLGQLSPSTVTPRLDEAVEALRGMMRDLEGKEDAIQQDLERKAEMQKTTLRTIVPLAKLSTPQQAPAFHAFVDKVLENSEWKQYKNYQA